MINLEQKSIVVTGGASGIGAAICSAAHKEGAIIGIIDIDEDAAFGLCEKLGDRAFHASGDVESEDSIKAALDKLSTKCLPSMAVLPPRHNANPRTNGRIAS